MILNGFKKESFSKHVNGKWDPPPFMANAILNFHFSFPLYQEKMNKMIVNCAKRSYLYQNWWSFPLYSGTLVKFALCDKMRFSRFSVIYRLQTVRFFPVWVSLRVLGMKWRAHCIQRLYSSYLKIQNFQWKEDKERQRRKPQVYNIQKCHPVFNTMILLSARWCPSTPCYTPLTCCREPFHYLCVILEHSAKGFSSHSSIGLVFVMQ